MPKSNAKKSAPKAINSAANAKKSAPKAKKSAAKDSKSAASTKWTVVFIVHAVDDQSRYYSEKLFTELLQTKGASHVRVFVLRNTYDYFDNNQTHARLWEIMPEAPRVKRRFPEEFPDVEGIKPNEKRDSFGDMNMDSINLGNKKTLENILRLIQAEVEESKIMLFTWDHGCAFGIFNSEELDDNTLPPIKSGPKTDMLMVSELAGAIGNSFGKVQMLIMMNCWMQSIETNAQLQDRTDVLIGAETTIDWIGYDYISIINKLVTDNDIPVTKKDKLDEYLNNFARQILTDTITKYKSPSLRIKTKSRTPDKNTDVRLEDIIISATRPLPAEIKKLSDHIDDIAIVLKNKLEEIKKIIIDARENTTELTGEFGVNGKPWCFVDLLNIFTRINAKEPLTENNFFSNLKEIFSMEKETETETRFPTTIIVKNLWWLAS